MKARIKEFWLSAAILVVLVLLCQAGEYYGWLSGINGPVFNRILATAPTRSDSLASAALVVVAIDDDAHGRCFNFESPMPPVRLFNLVNQIAKAKPSVIGVDVLTDSPKYTYTYQKQVKRIDASGATIVWASGADIPSGEGGQGVAGVSFPEWLLGKQDQLVVKPTRVVGYEPGELDQHPDITWALPLYSTDEDATIRRLLRTVWVSADPVNSERKEPRHSWAREVADAYCHRTCTPEEDDVIFLKYGGAEPRIFLMTELFGCPGKDEVGPTGPRWEEFRLLARGRIVLLGGTFRESNDFHRTPLGRLSGIIVNAYGVKAELRGDGVHDVRQPYAWILDVILGIAILWLFRSKGIAHQRWFESMARWLGAKRARVALTAALVLAVCIASRLISGGRYLLGFAGVGAGMLLHQLVELSEREEQEGETQRGGGSEPLGRGDAHPSGHHRKIDIHTEDIHVDDEE